jgi:DNA-directed RNA polymerase specialized sigma24 family protein
LVFMPMPFVSTRAKLVLSEEDEVWLRQLAQSRSVAAAKVQRGQILLRYVEGETVSAIAAALHTNRPKVERFLSQGPAVGSPRRPGRLAGTGTARPDQ